MPTALPVPSSCSAEEWDFLQLNVLKPSRSSKVCITCQHFRYEVDRHCVTLLTCPIHQGLIPHSEHLTRRFSQWLSGQEVRQRWCAEVGWSAFGVLPWTPTATTPLRECKCLLALVGRHERRGMSLAVSNPSGIFYEQSLLLLALKISAWIKYSSYEGVRPVHRLRKRAEILFPSLTPCSSVFQVLKPQGFEPQ